MLYSVISCLYLSAFQCKNGGEKSKCKLLLNLDSYYWTKYQIC
jgi:hypothetical protein